MQPQSGLIQANRTTLPIGCVRNGFFSRFPFSLPLAPALIVFFLGSVCAQGSGVNPLNLGKGDWIFQMSQTQARLGVSNTQAVINYEAAMGMQWITVKCADGSDTNDWLQFNAALVAQAHAAGMKIFGWAYAYGNQNHDVPGEINAALTCLDQGADGFIIDAEREYEAAGQSNAAVQYCQGIRARYPQAFLAYAPPLYISAHLAFPYPVFGAYCDAVMPQAYWRSFGVTPAQMVTDMDHEWSLWQSMNPSAIKPIIPIPQSYSSTPADIETGLEITAFFNALANDATPATAGGYRGASFWNCQGRNADMDAAVKGATIGGGNFPPQFAGISRLAGGTFQMKLTGQPGSVYAIDISSNLKDWTQLTNFTNSSGTYQFMDGAAGGSGRRYYRARLISP